MKAIKRLFVGTLAAMTMMASTQAHALLIIDGASTLVNPNNSWPLTRSLLRPFTDPGTASTGKKVIHGVVAVALVIFFPLLILDANSDANVNTKESLLANGYSAQEANEILSGQQMVAQRVLEIQNSQERAELNNIEETKRFVLATPNLPSVYIRYVNSEL